MQTWHSLNFIIGLLFCTSLQTAPAQTNVAFQNCQPGDLVRVKCDRPLLVLGNARLLEIGSNTVTVATANDRFTLGKTNVILIALESRAAAAPEVSPMTSDASPKSISAMPRPDVTAGAELLQTMESIRAAVIDPHKMDAYKEAKLVNGQWALMVDLNSTNGQAKYDQANTHYHQTMTGVMNGSVSQADLVRQAKEVLAQCDKFAAERKSDAQYEKQIETLRDFVRRSEAGEKIDFGKPVQ